MDREIAPVQGKDIRMHRAGRSKLLRLRRLRLSGIWFGRLRVRFWWGLSLPPGLPRLRVFGLMAGRTGLKWWLWLRLVRAVPVWHRFLVARDRARIFTVRRWLVTCLLRGCVSMTSLERCSLRIARREVWAMSLISLGTASLGPDQSTLVASPR